MRVIRLALAQINVTLGAFDANVARIKSALESAEANGADLVLFPEMTVCGYPPEDLLLKADFLQANRTALEALAPACKRITAVVGFADRADDVYNAAAVLHGGEIAGVYHKHHLPNYAVFDEKRYFKPGREPVIFHIDGIPFGVTICEDMWYPDGPHVLQAAEGAEILLCASASPFSRGKTRERERMLATRATDTVSVVAFCNLIGGQDELVFDGGSVIVDERGQLRARAQAFEEDLIYCDIDADSVFRSRLHDPRRRDGSAVRAELRSIFKPARHVELKPLQERTKQSSPVAATVAPEHTTLAEVHRAITLGLRDYVDKNGFQSVVLGLSGGIDSALSAALAVDALGPERVIGVAMASAFTSRQSVDDAEELAGRLGIRLLSVGIQEMVDTYVRELKPLFEGMEEDATEENLQARARGNVLMALSNKFGWLVIATGNKSEFAVGYCTLYGDMAGGFAVLKDVPKTLVYALSRHLNERAATEGQTPPIPQSTLTRPPTAELKADQRDEDSLPPYATLDPLLAAYIEEDLAPEALIARGFEPDMVSRVIRMVDCNEYKRRQAPPGIRITPRAFGRDRRLPITNHYRPRIEARADAREESEGSPASPRREGRDRRQDHGAGARNG
jgi:NAD+ synthase (glutamine-hydrolysing)